MITVGPNTNTDDVSYESREREGTEEKEVSAFISAVLKRSKKPRSLDDLTDAFEIQCEKKGMSRREKREAVRDFDNYRSAVAIKLVDSGVAELTAGRKLVWIKG